VAEALDEAGWKEILGTLAGDDTILCVTRTPSDTKRIQARLRRLLS
jgi:transcriptional regulator of arginine metabolism